MRTYEYTDPNGHRLAIETGPGGGITVAVVTADETVYPICLPLAAGELDRLVPALYKACGQPAPVVLPRPFGAGVREPVTVGPASILHTDHPSLPITLLCLKGNLTRQEARDLAAYLACWADDGDPAEVGTLADVIRSALARVQATDGGAEDVARAVLTAGWSRQGGSGS
ncbi:MAG: hypothetical protein M0030_11435 [Actinomycetota bacterium]|nr:hypothetical protein [Actinomycetota bacterium]